ncbi:MAG TPA: hypothetical protein VFV70_06065 [Hyphomonadaceae bacterium]|nr:hypothetical protein [Hyphomonadaceae bacterium]
MRAEFAAALTNFLLILLIAGGLIVPSSQPNAVHVYSDPVKAAITAVLFALLVSTPLAVIAFWRTWVHARRFLSGETSGWRGLLEAGALGFALTLPFVLPGVIARQFDPGPWGQPQAFVLGVMYVGAYGMLGSAVGLVFGFLLCLSTIATLLVHRRITSDP